ncbi:MAG TPA: SigB/SigF/SigG family RNA polymerase sigma factor [Solirubrobacteraceae bacterium]|nr:SigB/SigF/SigG family RNA polymerase sigma factor [Solirubrobacteraceae bacterium]
MSALQPRPAERDRMVERYLPLAETLARRYGHTAEPIDDLIQVARIGLIKAVDRFDPSRGLAFSTFAVPTITGELRRYFRDRTWTIRPPREVQELYLKVKRTRAFLSQELGREPTVGDVADRLGTTPEAIVDALAAGDAHSPVSLDCPHGDDRSDGLALMDLVVDPRRDLEGREDAIALWQLGAELSDREREVVRLRYQEDLLQRDIGERVGCSQMHVSRILSTALAHMHAEADRLDLAFD